MKYCLASLVMALALCTAGVEIDINGKFERGMDGWISVPKGSVTEIKTEEKDRFLLQLDTTGKEKKRILVYSRMYNAGSTGEKLTLEATASGTGAGFVGVVCFDQGGNQANILYRYFYPKAEMKNYSFQVILPESRLKDRKGNIRNISKIRIMFGAQPGSRVVFSEINAAPVEKSK